MRTLFLAAVSVLALSLNAQDKEKKKVDPKYYYCYKDATLDADDYKIYTEDALALDAFSKFKIRIFNKTNDYLIFKPADATFKIEGQDLVSKDKQIIVTPNDEGSRVIDVKGKGLQADKYVLDIKNLYKVSNNVPAVKVEDLAVPVTQKEFTAGSFKCKIKKADIQTNRSVFKIECTYDGDGIGILDPMKAVGIMPKGQENANADRQKAVLLQKGEVDVFSVEIREIKGGGDMQKEPWKIKWNETFKESKATPINGGKINFELDAKKTAEKNQ